MMESDAPENEEGEDEDAEGELEEDTEPVLEAGYPESSAPTVRLHFLSRFRAYVMAYPYDFSHHQRQVQQATSPSSIQIEKQVKSRRTTKSFSTDLVAFLNKIRFSNGEKPLWQR